MQIVQDVKILNSLYLKEEATVLELAQNIFKLTTIQIMSNKFYWNLLREKGCKYSFSTLKSRYAVIHSFPDLENVKTLKMSFSNYRAIAENGRSLDKRGKNIKMIVRSEAERKPMSFRDLEKLIKKYLNGGKEGKCICICQCGNRHVKGKNGGVK